MKHHSTEWVASFAAVLLFAFAGAAIAAPGDGHLSMTYDQDFLRVLSGPADGSGAAPGMLEFDGIFKSNNGDKYKVALLGTFGGSIAKRLRSIQTTSRFNAKNTFKVYQLWYEHHFGDSGVSVRLGLQDYTHMFNTLDAVKLFVNASFFLAPTISQAHPSAYPVTTLGAVAKWQSPSGFYLLGGIYDGTPGLKGHPHGTHVALNDGDGAFSDFEIGIDGRRPYKIGVGIWQQTASYKDPAGVPRNVNHGLYLFGGARLIGNGLNPTLNGFLELGSAEADRNKIHRYIGVGFKLTHFIPGRPKDSLGLAMARVLPTDLFKRVKSRAATNETIYELTYQAAVTKRLALQPDVQYVVNPGARLDVGNAWVVGLRIAYKI